MGRRKKTTFLEDSELVTSPDEVLLISAWINIDNVQTDLLYKGTKDGFTAQKFHELCDD
jgi:hypothetical protein